MTPLSVSSLVLAILGWVTYVPVAKTPGLRKTLWPTRALFVLALVLVGISAINAGPADPKLDAVGIATCVLCGLFAVAFVVMLRVPKAPGRPEAGKPLPFFQVTSEEGKQVSPDGYARKGPVLLVFFRGFW